MKVAWFDARDWHSDYVESEHEIDFFEASAHEVEIDSDYDAISVFVDSRVSGELIENIRPDKILCRSSGFDNVDIETAEEYGVSVSNVPDYGSDTVAEYTFALLLNLARKLEEDIGKDPNADSGLKGFELKNKTLGVIGAGNIGKEVIKRAKGFGMDVLAFDPYPDEEKANEIGYSYVGLEELLERSRFISINCPLLDSTKHLLSDEEFDKVDDVILVNTSRGPVIDTSALLKALENGSVAFAALDVIEEDFYEKIVSREDVLITPHNAYNTEEAERRLVDLTLEKI